VRIEFHPEARIEILQAAHWYEIKTDGLGAQYLREIDRGLDAVIQLPHAWPASSKRFRRFLLYRFPYSICYRIEGLSVMVYAVAHHKQRSGYWKKRKFS